MSDWKNFCELCIEKDTRIEELEAELKQLRLQVYSATGGCSYQRLAKALERVREMENDNLIPKE